jgi:integrase
MEQSTRDQYTKKVREVLLRALIDAKSKSHPFSVQTMMIIDSKTGDCVEVMDIPYGVKWIIKFYLSTWLNSTWRLKRSALNYELDCLFERGKISQVNYDKSKDMLINAKGWKQRSTNDLQTSSQRRKVLSERDFELLTEHFSTGTKSVYGQPTLYWLIASVLTGLRPSEWETARFESDDSLMLIVDNCKTTNGRSFGEIRKLDVSSFTEDEVASLKAHMKLVKLWIDRGMSFDSYHSGCSKALYRGCKSIWGNRRLRKISLYTGRHQFSANFKLVGGRHKERAAVMGHKTTKTSAAHYGRTSTGKSGVSIPDVGDMSVLNKIENPTNKQVRKPSNSKSTSKSD